MIAEARNGGRKVHFGALTDICHLKNSGLKPKFQKYTGWVVLRGDMVKDDSGSYAVLTEQGSSAPQITTAKVTDVIATLLAYAGQAADAVSAHTQVKMEDASTLLILPKSECPDIWIQLPRHKWPKSWSNIEGPVVLLDRHLYCYPVAGSMWERQFEKVPLGPGLEKVPNWECLFVHRKQGLCLSVYVDDITMAGRKQKPQPCVEEIDETG